VLIDYVVYYSSNLLQAHYKLLTCKCSFKSMLGFCLSNRLEKGFTLSTVCCSNVVTEMLATKALFDLGKALLYSRIKAFVFIRNKDVFL
jgi:hypothetical protein